MIMIVFLITVPMEIARMNPLLIMYWLLLKPSQLPFITNHLSSAPPPKFTANWASVRVGRRRSFETDLVLSLMFRVVFHTQKQGRRKMNEYTNNYKHKVNCGTALKTVDFFLRTSVSCYV